MVMYRWSTSVGASSPGSFALRSAQPRIEFHGSTGVKGEKTDACCEQVGEIAHQASCFRNVEF